MASQPVKTPLMDQYFAIKAEYPDALLLFRVGIFMKPSGRRHKIFQGFGYCSYAQGKRVRILCGIGRFSHHALDTYLPKLVRAGYKVAVCDQLEDPKLAKKIVKEGSRKR